MATASLTLSGSISNTPSGTQSISQSWSSSSANSQVQRIELASGANTITIPSTPAPTGCLIVLPSTNTAIVTLKGVSGDTGIAIGKTTSLLLEWDPTAVPASFVLTSASAQTGKVTEITFF